MGGRSRGWVVLVLALTVAVVIPDLGTKHIAGVATMAPPPPPPAAGQCIGVAFEIISSMTSTPAGWRPEYAHPPVGPCRGTVYGQITAIISDPVITSNDDETDANYEGCPDRSLHENLPPGSDVGRAYGHWYVSLPADIILIGPTPAQIAAGAHWAACVTTINQNDTNQTRGFDAPVSQWRHSRLIAEAMGQCLLVTSPGMQYTDDCTITHPAEIFGTTSGPLTPELVSSCGALVRDLTGMPDPTAGGRLDVEVLSYGPEGTQVTTPQARTKAGTSQECMVNGEHRSYLDGSLLALGDGPVPFG